MRPKVLIVDDLPALCRAIARELVVTYDVVTASTYDQALVVLAQHPDLAAIISDLLLGGGADGLDLLTAAQASAPGAIRLLITGTSHGLPADRAQVAHAVITKPWAVGSILSTIDELRAAPPRADA